MSKVTKCPKLQNAQNYKMSKITKCPKLQNVQNYKMSKVIKYPKLQLFGSFVLFLCSLDLVYNIIDKVLKIDATFHSCVMFWVFCYWTFCSWAFCIHSFFMGCFEEKQKRSHSYLSN